MTSTSHLIPAHGGELVQLIASPERSAELKAHSREWLSWDLTARQVCDLELLLSGGFSPLRGFMKRADYERVCHNMHLTSGVLWPMPITLDVPEEFAKKLQPGSSKVALRDPEGVMLAVLDVEEVWQPDRKAEAESVFGSSSAAHPGADFVLNKSNPWYVGGKLEGLQAPSHYDFKAIWHALIRKNHGVTHFIVGRDHAGPGKDTDGKPFYGAYEAQELFKKHEKEVGVTMVPFSMMVYLENQDCYVPDNEVPAGARVLNLSGTDLRDRLNEGRDIP